MSTAFKLARTPRHASDSMIARMFEDEIEPAQVEAMLDEHELDSEPAMHWPVIYSGREEPIDHANPVPVRDPDDIEDDER